VNWRRLLLTVGIGLTIFGLATLVAPGALDLGIGRFTVIAVALLALVYGGHLANVRRNTALERGRTPDPERAFTASLPGEELHEALRQFRGDPHPFYRMSGRDGLKVAAAAVLTRYEGVSKEEADEQITDGTWTDNFEAASFLSTGRTEAGASRGLTRWIRRDSGSRTGIEQSIEAIAAVADVSPREGGTAQATHTDSNRAETTAAVGADGTGLLARRETERWRGISAGVLVAVGAGVAFQAPTILLVGVVGLFYAAYARSHDLEAASLSVERSLADGTPGPGEEVAVTVRVTNDGSRVLPDVRVVDGVPGALAVTEGSPRRGTALGPGDTVEWTYTVTARRGVHEFDPALVFVRNAPGAVELSYAVAPEQPTAITCTPPLEALPVSVPLRGADSHYTGRQPTADSGAGTEFYGTRLYRHGDDISRIDWNRRAKTGELATLLFREEHTARVVLLVDTDPAAYVGPDPYGEHAVDRSVAAAGQTYATLANRGHFVGIGSLADTECWLEPGAGRTHRARARELLATHPALHSVPVADEKREPPRRARSTVHRRLPSGAQVIVFSPLCRRSIVRFIRRLEAGDCQVTVVSPDATANATPSQRLAQVGRRVHITDLRRDGIPVLDWGWDEPLAAAFARFETEVGSR
jgi:uncharacterized protein (DUF58 family)